jgi:uncharacterized protein with HEPN domain
VRSDRERLADIAETIDAIDRRRPSSLECLESDEVLAAAIVRWIEIIGEAASGLSDETRRELPDVPWPDIVAMRNRLIHGYPTVNLALVWGVIEKDLPPLRRSVTSALEHGRGKLAAETPTDTDDEPG